MATAIRTDLDFQDALRILNLPDAVASDQPVTLGQHSSALAAYVLLGGAATPQIINLGTAAGATAGAISSTVHATKGSLTVGGIVFDEANGRVGVGIAVPDVPLHVGGVLRIQPTTAVAARLDLYDNQSNSGSRNWTLKTSQALFGDLAFRVSAVQNGDPNVGTVALYMDSSANMSVGNGAFGSGATKVFALRLGSQPGSSVADSVQLFAIDQVANNTCLGIRTENNAIIKLFQGAAITSPSGGAIQDAESRATINNILSYLRASSGAGFISG